MVRQNGSQCTLPNNSEKRCARYQLQKPQELIQFWFSSDSQNEGQYSRYCSGVCGQIFLCLKKTCERGERVNTKPNGKISPRL